VAVLVAAMLVASAPCVAAAPELRLEPPVPLAEGGVAAPFTFTDATGRLLSLAPADLTVTLAGRPLARYSLARHAPAPGGRRSAVALLLAGPGRGTETATWVELLEEFARPAGAGAVRMVLAADDGLATWLAPDGTLPRADHLADRLTRERGGRFWDRVLAALRRLEGPRLPERRVLLIVAGAEEDRASAHPVAACREAAERARVAIYAVAAPAPGDRPRGAFQVRLQRLAEETGGRFALTEPARQADAVRRLLTMVDGAQALLLAPPPGMAAWPAELTVRTTAGGGAGATATVRPRSVIEARRWPLWPLAMVAVALAGIAVLVVLRRRRRVLHVLEVVTDGAVQRHAVPARGLTLGSGTGNAVVLPDRRVSRDHAVVRVRKDAVVLTDLRSTNGTQVNGRRVVTATLHDGDRIVLGGAMELIYRRIVPGRSAVADAGATPAPS
jgi:hypothetical protein